MKLFLHFIEGATEHIDTCIAQTDEDLTLEELVQLAIIDYRKDIQPGLVSLFKNYKYECGCNLGPTSWSTSPTTLVSTSRRAPMSS